MILIYGNRNSRKCVYFSRMTFFKRDEKRGEVPIRDTQTFSFLLRNRNRLPVIVRQNRDPRWATETRKVPCYSALLRNYVYVRTSERKQCLHSIPSARPGMVLKLPMRLRYRRWLLLLIPYPCLGVTSRSAAHIIGEYAVVLRRFASAKRIVAVFAHWCTICIHESDNVRYSLFFTRWDDHNCFDVIT